MDTQAVKALQFLVNALLRMTCDGEPLTQNDLRIVILTAIEEAEEHAYQDYMGEDM